jgi:adenylyltransferase/sulfurtransferase
MDFTEEQLQRYSRHIILPEVGGKGQKKISSAKVFIVGAGGLGCPVGFYLTAAGVGDIALIDNDNVELSNLQRQIAHSTKTLGMNKAESAKKTFETLNPDINVSVIKERINSKNIIDLIKDYDIVVDGSDNFPTRYLINDACVMLKKPLVSGAILRFEGQVTTILPGEGPCYRCLFEDPPPGTLQATEVLKLILGKGKPLCGQLLIYDALGVNFRRVKIPKNSDCAICGKNPTIKELTDSTEEYCAL